MCFGLKMETVGPAVEDAGAPIKSSLKFRISQESAERTVYL